MKTNYSIKTSLPAYKDNHNEKQKQAEKVLSFVNNGADNLLKIAQLTGLPQSTIAGRVNDLIEEGKIKYDGKVFFNDRLRKRIVRINRVMQTQLFL